MAGALRFFGFKVIRGSSTSGGAQALKAMIAELKKERYYVSFALDGPQGPRHRAKPGVHYVASKLNLPILQCLVRCERRWDFPKSWNKAYLPKPFARVEIKFFPQLLATEDNRAEVLRLLDARTDFDTRGLGVSP